MSIKIRLIQLGKRQVDLLEELHNRGHKEIAAPTLSNILNGRLTTPKAFMVHKLCDEILTEWEERRGKDGERESEL